MSVSLRPLMIPAVALAATGAVALGPTLVAPPAVTLAEPVVQMPVVHVEDVQLAGFAMDLYYALDGWVQFGVQVLQDFLFWNPELAAGVGSFYQTIRPVIEAAVTFVVGLIEAPGDLLGSFSTLVSSVLGIAPLAAASVAAPVAARTGEPPRAAASQAPVLAALVDKPAEVPAPEAAPAEEAAPVEQAAPVTEVTPVDEISEVSAPAPRARAEHRRAVRAGAVQAAEPVKAAAAVQQIEAPQATADRGEGRSAARAARGAGDRAAAR